MDILLACFLIIWILLAVIFLIIFVHWKMNGKTITIDEDGIIRGINTSGKDMEPGTPVWIDPKNPGCFTSVPPVGKDGSG